MPTRDTCLISFNLGADKLEGIEKVLRRAGLEDAKGIERDGVLAGYCAIELPVTDPRLDVLIRELDASQRFYTLQAKRRYSERELDPFPWLVLRINTAGLSGGVNLGQAYNMEGACPTCGSGSVPNSPLLAATARMGKKAIDCTAHDGQPIVTTALGDAIHAAGLTGFVLEPVSRGPRRHADPAYRWLRIISDWARLSPKSVLKKDDICPSCGRAGHYDPGSRATEYWCDSYPSEGADFNWTWECFGRWRMNAQDGRPNVGGFRRLVVSQRVRTLFNKVGVLRVSLETKIRTDTPELSSKGRSDATFRTRAPSPAGAPLLLRNGLTQKPIGIATAEISTEENEKLVSEVFTQAMNRVHSGQSLEEPDRIVWEIEGLSMEVNSGASYEQYFRWRPVSEISTIVARLRQTGLPEVAKLTQRAIEVAFAGGLPKTDAEKDDLTDWSEAQDTALEALGDQFTEYNGRIANVLAVGYRQAKSGPDLK